MNEDIFMPPLEPDRGAQPVMFRKGVLVAFNPADGTNQVRVGGGVLPNLPMLVSGSETAFVVGQTVAIMVVGTEMFIIGRIAIPGAPSYASTTSAFKSATAATSGGFGLTGGVYDTLCTCSIVVPTWATRAFIIGTSAGNIYNNTAGDATLSALIDIPGAPFTGTPFGFVKQNTNEDLTRANNGNIVVTPGSTLTFAFKLFNGGAFPFKVDNQVGISITAIFTTA